MAGSIPQIKQSLAKAFSDRPDLAQGLANILDRSVFDAATLRNLADYVLALKNEGTNGSSQAGPLSKKRKIDGDAQDLADVSGSVLFTCADISFSVPVRKKLRLEGVKGGLRGIDAAGNAEVSLGWHKIDQVFCLPVPDRAKPQQNFVVLPQQELTGVDAIVFTAPEQNPKAPDPTHTADHVADQLNKELARYNKQVLYPEEEEFVSQAKQARGQKSLGVRAHRGTKDGHLFFLAAGILFAFKKPLLFLPFHAITSISYTSVLQRTFNLNVVATEIATGNETEIEFSMLDQEDFAGIDDYIKRHGLNDASLADKRRAKVYGINAPKNKDATQNAGATQNGAAEDIAGESEIQKAERLLQDAEDDEEEDYVEGQEDDDDESDDEDYASGDEEEGEGEFEEEEDFDNEEGGYEDEGGEEE